MLSVVIPAFNEEGSIVEVVESIASVLGKSDYSDYEIIVVDDGSTDRTGEFAKKSGARVVRNVQNLGYGFSLKQGINAAQHDTIAISDADGTYPIKRLPALLKKYDEGFDLVVGQRTGPHYRESTFKYPLRYILKLLVEFAAGREVPDVNSGFRVFSKEFVTSQFPRLSNRFSFTTSQTIAYMQNLKFVHYTPIDYDARIGETKVRLFRDSLSALQMIMSAILFLNPLKLFLVLCILSALTGVVTVLASLYINISSAVLLGIFSFLIALIIAALGFLADIIRQQNSHDPSK